MPDINIYLANRKNHLSQTISLARASRCKCRADQSGILTAKNKILNYYECIQERIELGKKLEKINISAQEGDNHSQPQP